jgi:large subunit ribosomal protein L23
MSRTGKDPRDIIIEPVVSEKSYDAIERNVFTFRVAPSASKPEIRNAIEQIFDVRVLQVNTLNRRGKQVRSRRRFTTSKRPDTKRAMVTVHADDADKIDIFEA